MDQLLSALRVKYPGKIELSNAQLERLMTVPKQNVQCWLSALVYYFTTGDLIGAVAKAIECLMAKGVGATEILECVVAFITTVVENGFTIDAVIGLFLCVLGQGNGGGDDGQFGPPNYRKVKRCG